MDLDQNYPETTETPESVPANVPRDYIVTNRLYDVLKPVTALYLPGVITLWLTLVAIWELGYGEQVALTLGGINVFLGVVLQGASRSYNNSTAKYDGFIELTPSSNPGQVDARINVDKTGEVLAGKKQVLLNVDNKL